MLFLYPLLIIGNVPADAFQLFTPGGRNQTISSLLLDVNKENNGSPWFLSFRACRSYLNGPEKR